MQARLKPKPFVLIDDAIFELPHRTHAEIGIYTLILYSIKKFKCIDSNFLTERTRMPVHLIEEYTLDLIRLGIIILPKNNQNGNL